MAETARRYGSVQDIVIAEAHRGKGIGQALLAEAERLTREAGMTRLKLTVLSGNDVAVDAYGRFGFRDYAAGHGQGFRLSKRDVEIPDSMAAKPSAGGCGRSLNSAMPMARLTPVCACTLSGCSANVLLEPPTNRLAPAPTAADASALAPT